MKWVMTFACLLAAISSLAAPVPKPKGEFQRLEWGRPIDPDETCKFTFCENGVTIEAPGGYRDLHPGGPTRRSPGLKTNAPRLMRATKGDFAVEVRVAGEPRVAGGDWAGEVSAGLVVTDKTGKVAAYRVVWGMHNSLKRGGRLFAYARMGANEREMTSWQRETRPTVKAVSANGGLKKAAYVKIERRGGRLKSFCSADGKLWSLIPRPAWLEDVDTIKGEVMVGVALFTRSSVATKVSFDRFKLTPLKTK